MKSTELIKPRLYLQIFDIDETLFVTNAKIKVVKNGKIVSELTNQEFNTYTLKPGERFDFSEFRSAQKFYNESVPIKSMIKLLKHLSSTPGNRVIMLTAREDFDNKELFLQTFNDLGIDMEKIHVHRAGNLPGDVHPAYKKEVWVKRYLDSGLYNQVSLYDDSEKNLVVFKNLRDEYPNVTFNAYLVGHGGKTQTVEHKAK
jgi:hypothetical protein